MYGNLERNKTPSMFNNTSKKSRSIVALHAIEFFDKNDACILSAGFFLNKNA